MKRIRKSVVPDVRQLNRSMILRRIYTGESISRQKLSQDSGLSSATVTNVVVELLEEGIVIESGSEASQGGRPRSILTINPSYGYFIGVDIGETFIRIELFDLTLRRLSAVAYPQVLDESHPESIIEYIRQGVTTVLAEAGLSLEQVIGMGIGVGGLVELDEQTSAYVPGWGWQRVQLVPLLEKHFSFPISLDNAAKVMTQAEGLFGAGHGCEHFAVLLVGTGIGAGVIANDSLYRGAENHAGEWGHTTIALNGRLCRCGSYGCLEAYVGAPAIIERWREAEPHNPLLQDDDQERNLTALVEAARAGNPAALAVLTETAHYLGAGIANLINLFNPRLVVLGGWAGMSIGEAIFSDLCQFVERYALKRLFARTQIKLSHLGQEAVALGAAALALDRFFLVAGGEHLPALG